MLGRKGSGRIGKIIGRVKNDISELEKGICEVNDEISTNNDVVDYQRGKLAELEAETVDKNKILETARDMAVNVSNALESLLGVK